MELCNSCFYCSNNSLPTCKLDALATDARRDNKGNVNIWGGPAPVLGKETSFGTDMATGAAAEDAKSCHE
jgi:hypothetical protein